MTAGHRPDAPAVLFGDGVLTYRELRKLELEVLLELHTVIDKAGTQRLQREMSLDEINQLSKLNVHQFYGIEIEDFRSCRFGGSTLNDAPKVLREMGSGSLGKPR